MFRCLAGAESSSKYKYTPSTDEHSPWPDQLLSVLDNVKDTTRDAKLKADALRAVQHLTTRLDFLRHLDYEEKASGVDQDSLSSVYEFLGKSVRIPRFRVSNGVSHQESDSSKANHTDHVSVKDILQEKLVVNKGVGIQEELKDRLYSWEFFDVFKLNKYTEGRPLFYMTLAIFQAMEFHEKFELDGDKFVKFMDAVEKGYKKENATYHNNVHAADVTHAVFIMTMGIRAKIEPLDQLALILAAMVHDLEHPGVNNDFLVSTDAEVAQRYNNQSVNENHHISAALKLLNHPEMNFLCGLSLAEQKRIKEKLIGLILATDMARHGEVVERFRTAVEKGKKLEDWNDVMPCLKMILHCADIGNPAKKPIFSRRWTDRVMAEFFAQGDLERSLGLQVSAPCDRCTVVVAKAQIAFIDFIVKPALSTFFLLPNEMEERIMGCLEETRASWHSELYSLPQSKDADYFAKKVDDITEEVSRRQSFLNDSPSPSPVAFFEDMSRRASETEAATRMMPDPPPLRLPNTQNIRDKKSTYPSPEIIVKAIQKAAETSPLQSGLKPSSGLKTPVSSPPRQSTDVM